MKLTKAEFLKFHSGYYGEETDNINQIVSHTFNGATLFEYMYEFKKHLESTRILTDDEILDDLTCYEGEDENGVRKYNDAKKWMKENL